MNFDCPDELKDFKFFKEVSDLQSIVTRGVREAYSNAISNHSSESFYAFGIDVPSDLGAFYFGGNTEENFTRMTAQDKRVSYYDRWCWHEWGAYEVLEPQPLMSSTWHWVDERSELLEIKDDALANFYFEHQQAIMYKCAISALKENDEAHLFGNRCNHNEIILYASVTGFDEYYFFKSVRELNSEAVWNAVRQDFLPHLNEFSDEAKELLV